MGYAAYHMPHSSGAQYYPRGMYVTHKSKELIDSLPDALSKFLIYVLLQKPDVKLKDGINFFAQISNPHSLSKVTSRTQDYFG